MADHTPGPWTIQRYGDGDSLVIHSDADNRVCFMATAGSYGDPAIIAADARLIAAAPDLLAALRTLYREIDDRHHGRMPDEVQHAMDDAAAAIAKASNQPKETR